MRGNVSRAGRREQITLLLARKSYAKEKQLWTMYQVAEQIGLKPSNHVTKLLNELVNDGVIKGTWQKERAGRWRTKLYWIKDPEKYIKTRLVAINYRGEKLSQMDMFQ